ncbi:MarR family transcriptional regulator for hemolysin [Sphingobium sp. B7D2B]|uniref:MarR family winged helix-turn-helix transcriptional regulator n=1 Tax=Sphingobium sp. B7D2B TaxID=2940583 RepID=UPI0022253B2A|nr:MarR family transcriptional regulator [Sphingobium sp. B7D2B]MCW2365139.1 MarR family transcriptional regulator for hemolysin [Sphingobium sp. B7D2B]
MKIPKRANIDRAAEGTSGPGEGTPPSALPHYAQWYQQGSIEDLRFRFTSRLREAMRMMRVMLEEELRAEGQTRALWEALLVIVLSGGHSTQKSLANRLRIEGATLVRLLDALEADGLIERVPGLEDRRSKMIKPTSKGLALAKRLVQRSDEVRARLLDGWTEADLHAGIAMLNKFGAAPTAQE